MLYVLFVINLPIEKERLYYLDTSNSSFRRPSWGIKSRFHRINENWLYHKFINSDLRFYFRCLFRKMVSVNGAAALIAFITFSHNSYFTLLSLNTFVLRLVRICNFLMHYGVVYHQFIS